MPTKVKIDFLVAGFSKCGTTTLCAALSRHPDIFIPVVKEPRYFSSTDFENGHEVYDQLFEPASPHQKKGEGSPSYSSAQREDDSIARIRDNNPDCRFVFIARHPKRRIESSYREMQHSGVRFGLNAPFELGQCISEYPQMVNDSLFYSRIEKYIATFGRESVRVVFLEDLSANLHGELKGCFEHIGVDPARTPEFEDLRLNSGSQKLYDTRLMRYLRGNIVFGPQIAKIDPAAQDKLFSRLLLRKPFKGAPIVWDEQALAAYRELVVPEARKFLKLCDKPPEFWQLDSQD
jgi:Sulfotransferase domain